MKSVHYTRPRPGFSRVLRPIDLASLGIQSKENLEWSGANNFCLVLNNKLSESLVEKLPAEFVMVDVDGDESDDIDDADAILQAPLTVSNDSLKHEHDDDESSTLDEDEES